MAQLPRLGGAIVVTWLVGFAIDGCASVDSVAPSAVPTQVLGVGPTVSQGGLGAKQADIAWLTAIAQDTSQRYTIGSTKGSNVTITDVLRQLQGGEHGSPARPASGAQFYEYYDPSKVTGYSFINVFGTDPRTVHFYASTDCTRFNDNTVAELHATLNSSYNGTVLFSDTMDWADLRYGSSYKDYTISGAPQNATISTKHVCYDSNNPDTAYSNSSAARTV